MSQFSALNKPLPTIPILSSSSGGNDVILLPSGDSGLACVIATSDTTKRDYALLELLDSERTYVSDLILVRDYQIPLASGRLSSISSILPISDSEATICRYPGLELPLSDIPGTAPGSSGVAPRPLTTASDASALSLDSIFTLRPMKTKDIHIVFGNIDELAAFSETFLDRLESALGELIEGNEGEDHLGRLFLDSIPQMEPLYRTYVMNQSHALEHYHRLSKTFQFDVYLPRSQILAHKFSNAWDLPSLLIKPIQRLLHYPPLLAAIVAATPDSHGDKANLVEVLARIGELARRLGAEWSQQKVVQGVLASAGTNNASRGGDDVAQARKKEGLNRGFAAPVSLGRVTNPRLATVRAKEEPEASAEAEAVMAMDERLESYKPFMMQIARDAEDWTREMRNVVGALEEWAESFGKVIWMDPSEGRSDAFEAFLALVSDQLLAACDELRAEIEDDVLQTVESLRDTMVTPMRLLEAMQTLEPVHHTPLNIDLTASESYVALRTRLFAELPTYLKLLDRGIAACIPKLAHVQQHFYSRIHDRWAELWDRIEVDRHANQGLEEMLRVWSRQDGAVEAQVTSLSIVRRSRERPTAAERGRESGERYTTGGHMHATSSSRARLDSLIATLERTRVPTRPILLGYALTSPPRPPPPPPPPLCIPPQSKRPRRLNYRTWPEELRWPEEPSSSPEHSTAMIGLPSPAYHIPTVVRSRVGNMPISRPPNKSHSSRTYLDVGEWVAQANTYLSMNGVSSSTVREDGYAPPLRRSSSQPWSSDYVLVPSPYELTGRMNGTLQPRRGAIYTEEMVKPRQQALVGVRTRTIDLPTVSEEEETDAPVSTRVDKLSPLVSGRSGY